MTGLKKRILFINQYQQRNSLLFLFLFFRLSLKNKIQTVSSFFLSLFGNEEKKIEEKKEIKKTFIHAEKKK